MDINNNKAEKKKGDIPRLLCDIAETPLGQDKEQKVPEIARWC